MHLRLPGGGADGPTLEIFSYSHAEGPRRRQPPRFRAHRVCGGVGQRGARRGAGRRRRAVGEVVTMAIAGGGRVTWCYVTDPERNIIELQAWS